MKMTTKFLLIPAKTTLVDILNHNTKLTVGLFKVVEGQIAGLALAGILMVYSTYLQNKINDNLDARIKLLQGEIEELQKKNEVGSEM